MSMIGESVGTRASSSVACLFEDLPDRGRSEDFESYDLGSGRLDTAGQLVTVALSLCRDPCCLQGSSRDDLQAVSIALPETCDWLQVCLVTPLFTQCDHVRASGSETSSVTDRLYMLLAPSLPFLLLTTTPVL